MRSITKTRSLILGGVLTGALTLGGVQMASGENRPATPQKSASSATSKSASPSTTTVTERGIVLEGKGTWRGQPVTVHVYENQRFGNSLQIVVGDPDGRHEIAAGEGRHAYVIDGVLNVGLDVDGDLAVVKGTVKENGPAAPATETAPDGELLSSRGTHTPLLVEATFEYRGQTVNLEFPKAFEYDLESTRTGLG